MLYLIGTGIGNGLSSEAIEILKGCKKIYLESYTSVFQGDLKKVEKLINKKVEKAERDFVESYDVSNALKENVALLIIGDVFSATTHISLFNDCKEKNVEVKILNNSSILTAIGITGLELYKFGKTASIPFNNKNIETPFKILENNRKINAHTLFLLDLDPLKDKFLNIREGIEYLEKRGFKGKVVGCARLGSDDFVIKYGDSEKVKEENFGEGPYCIIVPSDKLHFMEEEVLKRWEL